MAKSGYERVKDCIARNYDKVYLFIPKGKKAEIQALAASQGHPSVQGWINTAIQQRIDRATGKSHTLKIGDKTWETIQIVATVNGESPLEYLSRVISEALERDR